METITITLEKFDFDYWSNNRIIILIEIIKRRKIEDIGTLSHITGISYASTHKIINEFLTKKLVNKKGREIKINEDWKRIFNSEN